MVYGDGNEMIVLKIYDHETAEEEDANNLPLSFSADAIYGGPNTPYVISIGNVGVDELLISNYELWVYPNPTKGVLQVISNESQAGNIEIYDILGRRIDSFACPLKPFFPSRPLVIPNTG